MREKKNWMWIGERIGKNQTSAIQILHKANTPPHSNFKVQGFTAKGLNKYCPIYNWHLKALVSKDPIQWHQSQFPDYDHFMRRGGNFTPVSFLTFMAVEISLRMKTHRRIRIDFLLHSCICGHFLILSLTA